MDTFGNSKHSISNSQETSKRQESSTLRTADATRTKKTIKVSNSKIFKGDEQFDSNNSLPMEPKL